MAIKYNIEPIYEFFRNFQDGLEGNLITINEKTKSSNYDFNISHRIFKYSEFNYNFFLELLETMKDILYKYNFGECHIEYIKDNVYITVILKHCVVRLLPLDEFTKLKEFYYKQFRTPHKNIEYIKNIYEKSYFVIIVSEKLDTIKTYDGKYMKNMVDKDKWIEHINSALDFIHNMGLVHQDVSYDNTGIRIVNDNYDYVLFDFDMMRYGSSNFECIRI